MILGEVTEATETMLLRGPVGGKVLKEKTRKLPIVVTTGGEMQITGMEEGTTTGTRRPTRTPIGRSP